ncbi:MAG: hypothetical protein GX979_08585, partial [Firmicutes bacterium]|nr:hypothetical protein [Bacillota bacterium]
MLSEEEVLRRKAELEERRQLKRAYRRRQIIMYSVSSVVAIILMIVTAFFTYQRGVVPTQSSAAGTQDRLLVLFLGTDEKLEASTRADSMMLISLDTATGEAGVLSIPRDT